MTDTTTSQSQSQPTEIVTFEVPDYYRQREIARTRRAMQRFNRAQTRRAAQHASSVARYRSQQAHQQ